MSSSSMLLHIDFDGDWYPVVNSVLSYKPGYLWGSHGSRALLLWLAGWQNTDKTNVDDRIHRGFMSLGPACSTLSGQTWICVSLSSSCSLSWAGQTSSTQLQRTRVRGHSRSGGQSSRCGGTRQETLSTFPFIRLQACNGLPPHSYSPRWNALLQDFKFSDVYTHPDKM